MQNELLQIYLFIDAFLLPSLNIICCSCTTETLFHFETVHRNFGAQLLAMWNSHLFSENNQYFEYFCDLFKEPQNIISIFHMKSSF